MCVSMRSSVYIYTYTGWDMRVVRVYTFFFWSSRQPAFQRRQKLWSYFSPAKRAPHSSQRAYTTPKSPTRPQNRIICIHGANAVCACRIWCWRKSCACAAICMRVTYMACARALLCCARCGIWMLLHTHTPPGSYEWPRRGGEDDDVASIVDCVYMRYADGGPRGDASIIGIHTANVGYVEGPRERPGQAH